LNIVSSAFTQTELLQKEVRARAPPRSLETTLEARGRRLENIPKTPGGVFSSPPPDLTDRLGSSSCSAQVFLVEKLHVDANKKMHHLKVRAGDAQTPRVAFSRISLVRVAHPPGAPPRVARL
jgi:hypothetical protein